MKPRKKTKPKGLIAGADKKPEPKQEEKKPMTRTEVGEVKPFRGLWQLELDKAEEENNEGKGRKWFNGRPIREIVKKIEDIFIIGGGVKQACAHAEISKQTYYEFLQDKPHLDDHFKDLQERLTIVALNTVAKAVPLNPNMAMTILERRMNKEYAETKNVNINAHSTSFSVNAQLMALKNEFDKRFLDEINKADIQGKIPQDSDDFVMEPPKELLDKTDQKMVKSKEQVGGAAIPSGS